MQAPLQEAALESQISVAEGGLRMNTMERSSRIRCMGCAQGQEPDFRFTMAFQPIVDVRARRVWGYEALVRGENGESAGEILAQVTEQTQYRFDQACRVRAIEMAGTLFTAPDTRLSINFLPNAVYEPTACIQASIQAATRVGLDPRQLMFEFTEGERLLDVAFVSNIVERYREIGMLTALDDFGAGYSGLLRLALLQPDILKIDMGLVRDIDEDRRRQSIVAAIVTMAADLGITLIAEGVETRAETEMLRTLGISLFQGYHFARPRIGALPPVSLD